MRRTGQTRQLGSAYTRGMRRVQPWSGVEEEPRPHRSRAGEEQLKSSLRLESTERLKRTEWVVLLEGAYVLVARANPSSLQLVFCTLAPSTTQGTFPHDKQTACTTLYLPITSFGVRVLHTNWPLKEVYKGSHLLHSPSRFMKL